MSQVQGEKQLVNADLQAERNAARLQSEDFAVWFAGGRESLIEKRRVEQQLFSDPDFNDVVHYGYLSHKEFYEHTIKKNVTMLTKLKKIVDAKFGGVKNFTLEYINELTKYTSGHLGLALFPQMAPFTLHYAMFMKTIFVNGTEEQQKEWIPKAWNLDGWIGTYAQTELGHGTYVRGLETRVDYDIAAKEFVLNTPTLSAYKWWPGGMGNTANKAIITAPLFINNKPCGLQQFLVPLRDENTHQPLPGRDIGEIGPKIGVNTADNGFLGFKNVRIPLKNMLMKHAKVTPDGKFKDSSNPTLLYGTMTIVRTTLVYDCARSLLAAATIATR